MSTVKYENPIVPGFAPDPSVVLVDGVYFLATSSFHIFPGIPIYASEDLQDWKLVGHGINRVDQLPLENATTNHVTMDNGLGLVVTGGLYAPTIRHHKGTFFIVCTNCVSFPEPGRKGHAENFIISTKDIWSGGWSDPIYFPHKGIDPDIFFDDDGRIYIQGARRINYENQPTFTIAQFEIDITTGQPLEEPREIWGGFAKHDTESPHIYKKDGWYYLLVAEGGTFEHHMLCIARSRSVQGPYESVPTNPIMTSDGKDVYVQNVGHGDLFQDIGGQWWAVVLGVREQHWPLGRETFLTPVTWPDGEWPTVSQPTMCFERRGSLQAPDVDSHDKPSLRSKTRAMKAQNPELVYIRNADLERYRFDQSERNMVSLSPTPSTLSSPRGSMTFVGMRQRALDCTASVVIDIPMPESHPGETIVGLALYKDHLRHASISYATRSRALILDVQNVGGECRQKREVLSSPSTQLHLQIRASPKEYIFKYQNGDFEELVHLGSVQVSNLFARDFTGPIFGIYTYGVECGSCWVGFRDFEVTA